MGHVGVGWVMQGWGGSCRGGWSGSCMVGWVMQGGLGHVGVMVGWVMYGWSGSCRGGVG